MNKDDILRRCEALLGLPFVCLPGKPPDHKVVGNFSDGSPIRALAVETCWNDMKLIDGANGVGTYGKSIVDSERGREVFALALKLYAGIE